MNNYDAVEMMEKIREISKQINEEYLLNLKEVRFVEGDTFYGKCSIDGVITLKIQYLDGELIPEVEVWRTVAHELSHLKYFNHSPDFWEFNKELVLRISSILGKKVRPEIAFTRNGVIY